jgi:cytochrome c556
VRSVSTSQHGLLTSTALCLLVVIIVEGMLFAAPRNKEKPERARPPKWSQDDLDTFFEDARKTLVGRRPDYSMASGQRQLAVTSPPATDSASPFTTHTAPGQLRWSTLISPETIEDEIKRIGRALREHVKTPSAFKGGGYRDCRQHFSMLAALFAVAAEHDADVRWNENAASLRDRFARAGFNCKAGSDATFNEARQRVEDLDELIRGGRIGDASADRAAVWPEVADRPPLMARMETAFEEQLDPLLADGGAFRKNADEIRHHAELVALLAELVPQEGYEYADDEDFVEHAQAVRDAAKSITEAVESRSYQPARAAAGRISKACSECHEGYKS